MSNVQAVKDNAKGLFSALCALGAQATQVVVAKVAEGANVVNAKLQAAAATQSVVPASAPSDHVREVAKKEYEAYLLDWNDAIEEDARRNLYAALKLQNS